MITANQLVLNAHAKQSQESFDMLRPFLFDFLFRMIGVRELAHEHVHSLEQQFSRDTFALTPPLG